MMIIIKMDLKDQKEKKSEQKRRKKLNIIEICQKYYVCMCIRSLNTI